MHLKMYTCFKVSFLILLCLSLRVHNLYGELLSFRKAANREQQATMSTKTAYFIVNSNIESLPTIIQLITGSSVNKGKIFVTDSERKLAPAPNMPGITQVLELRYYFLNSKCRTLALQRFVLDIVSYVMTHSSVISFNVGVVCRRCRDNVKNKPRSSSISF